MGIDSRYHLPTRIKREDLEEFLLLLGYEKFRTPKFLREYKATTFSYFSRQPYESLQGVTFTVTIQEGQLVASGRNNTWRNKADNDFHNYTLKQLCKRLGGYFVSDYGRNRYFPFDGIERKNDESGCHIETERALDQLKKMSIVTMSLEGWKTPVQKGDMLWMNQAHPEVIFSNLAVVHILSVIEAFFRNIYVALLTYSEKKTETIKSTQIRPSDLIDVGSGSLRVEQAFANSLNFQNVKSICEIFDRLDQKLTIRQELYKTHGRRKENFYGFIERIAAHRHRYVHHGENVWDYDLQSFQKDLIFCERLIHGVYKTIAERSGWPYEKPY